MKVFPTGLLDFQINVGEVPSTILGSFDSQNSCFQRISNDVFGFQIKEDLLDKAFGLTSKELLKLKKRFSENFNGSQ